MSKKKDREFVAKITGDDAKAIQQLKFKTQKEVAQMNDEDVKALRGKKAKERRAALTAGRAWAESDRSYNAVKATVEYFAAVIHYGFEDPVSDFHYQIMMKEVGKDDTEFNEVMNGDTKKSGAWLSGVCEAFAGMIGRKGYFGMAIGIFAKS